VSLVPRLFHSLSPALQIAMCLPQASTALSKGTGDALGGGGGGGGEVSTGGGGGGGGGGGRGGLVSASSETCTSFTPPTPPSPSKAALTPTTPKSIRERLEEHAAAFSPERMALEGRNVSPMPQAGLKLKAEI
jgi:hypothetical protein